MAEHEKFDFQNKKLIFHSVEFPSSIYGIFGDSLSYLIGLKPVCCLKFLELSAHNTQKIILHEVRLNTCRIRLNQTLEKLEDSENWNFSTL